MFKNVVRCLFPRRVLPLSQSGRDDSTFDNERYLSLLLFQQPVTGHKRNRSTYSGIPLYGHPLNTDTGYYGPRTISCVPGHKLLYIVNPALPTDTGFPRTFYFPSHNHLLIIEIERCSNNDRFLWVNTIFFTVKKQQQNSTTCLILISPSFFSSLTLVLKPFNKVFCLLLTSFPWLFPTIIVST